MDRTAMKNLFVDAFGPWVVIINERAEEWEQYGNIVHGFIYCGGVYAGEFKRRVTDNVVYHDGLYLKTLPFKGRGFAREWEARCAERYRAAGIQSIHLIAVQDGRFAWRRLGFVADALTTIYDRERAVKDAEAVLDQERYGGDGLGKTDIRRWRYFTKKVLANENVTIHDIMDWQLADGRTIAGLLRVHSHRFKSGAILGWHGEKQLVA